MKLKAISEMNNLMDFKIIKKSYLTIKILKTQN